MSDFLSIFVRHPLLAVAPGLLFIYLAVRHSRPVIWIAAAAWLLYALYELGVSVRLLCTGECNVRADLVLLYPVLLVLSIAAALRSVRPCNAGGPHPCE